MTSSRCSAELLTISQNSSSALVEPATTEQFLKLLENRTTEKNKFELILELGCDIKRDGYLPITINVTITAENRSAKDVEIIKEWQSVGVFQAAVGTRGRCGGSTDAEFVPYDRLIDCCKRTDSADYDYRLVDDNGEFLGALNRSEVITPFSCIKINSTDRNDLKAAAIGKVKVKLTWCKLSLCAEERTNVTIKSGTMVSENTTWSPIKLKSNSDKLYTAKDNEFLISRACRMKLYELSVGLMGSSEFGRHADYIMRNGWPSYFGVMATVLITIVQNSALPVSERILGQAYTTDTFMEVQWAWFSMPLFLLVSTILLLIITARRSAWKTYLFKSSALAIVFHGLESEASGRLKNNMNNALVSAGPAGTVTSATLHRMAKECNVRFGPNANGELKLLKVD